MIEALEPRIAPASLNGKVLTYTDADGDQVTIKFKTKGALTAANLVFDTDFDAAGPQQLRTIILTDESFNRTSLTVTTVQAGGGNGTADIGFIDATERDLGTVKIDGDLARLIAGDGNSKNGAVGTLSVGSIGERGTSTVAPGIDSIISLNGGIKQLRIAGNLHETPIYIGGTEAAHGKIGKLIVGGSIIGGSAYESGHINTSGSVGQIQIAMDLVGSVGHNSGYIDIEGGLKKLFIGGSIRGGSGSQAGFVNVESGIGSVFVRGDIIGGDGSDDCGRIFVEDGGIKKVVVEGSIIGGSSGASNGGIRARGLIASAMVKGDLTGGDGDGSGTLVADRLGNVKILGSLIGGSGANAGSIQSRGDIKSVTIGSVEGDEMARALIAAAGSPKPGKTKDVAINKVTIEGNAEFLDILAGYRRTGSTSDPVVLDNPDAQINSVTVKGNFKASSIVAGVEDTMSNGFGNDDDFNPIGKERIISTIAKVVINGAVLGTDTPGDHFGITASFIKKVTIGTFKYPLDKLPYTDTFSIEGGSVEDFAIHEIRMVT